MRLPRRFADLAMPGGEILPFDSTQGKLLRSE